MIPNVQVRFRHGLTYNWWEITNEVIFPLKFYWQKRNSDYSLTYNDLTIYLKKSAFNSAPNYYDNGDYRIEIKIDNVIRFAGYIYEIAFIRSTQTWAIKCHQDWYRLKELPANTNIFSFISSGATVQQFYTDNNGYSYVQILWLIKRLFYMCDLGLDITDAENALYRARDDVYYHADIYYRHLKLDLNMLQCWNQPDTANRINLINNSSSRDYGESKLSAWEVVSYLCSVFGFSIVQTGNEFYKLYHYRNPEDRNYSINDADLYDYNEEFVKNEWNSTEGFTVNYTLGSSEDSGNIIPSQERVYYYDTSKIYRPRNVKEVVVGEGKESVDLMKHFLIIMEHGDNNPPIHNLSNTVDPRDVSIILSRPKYLPHKVQLFKRKVDFSKPCVNENLFVLDKTGYYCEIKQDTMYFYS